MELILEKLGAEQTLLYVVIFLLGIGLSAYVKIATVLGFVRAGFGFNSIPSVFITTALALSLSLVVMEPVAEQVLQKESTTEKIDTWKSYLSNNAQEQDLETFGELHIKAGGTDKTSFGVVSSAFLVTQLREAFAAGLMLFIPFLVIELLVSLFCSAAGFNLYSAQFLSLPLKVLLFISLDGWGLITENLVKSVS